VPGLMLAAVNPDNTPHGYNWTFAFPMLLFIVIAAILYALFSRPHRRIPAGRITGASSRLPDAGTAAASVAGGLGVAPGGGTTEAAAEPSGAHIAATETEGGATAASAPDATSEPGATAPAQDTEAGEADE